MFADLKIKSYHSERAADFAAHVIQRQRAERARLAGRQAAHNTAASARAAEKREAKRLEIAQRPRGKTDVIGFRADGRPIHRAIQAFRARPYTSPEQRATRADVGAMPIEGMRSHEETRAAALKAESPQPLPLQFRVGTAAYNGDIGIAAALDAKEDKRIAQRAARKVRMARIRRRGW